MRKIIIDLTNKDNATVAREIMTEVFKAGYTSHVQNYMGDIFIDFEQFCKRIPEGIWCIRDMGSWFVPSDQFMYEVHGENKKIGNFRERMKSTYTNCGRMTRFFRLTKRMNDNTRWELHIEEETYLDKEKIDLPTFNYFTGIIK